jgi:hypothetical protein
MGNQLDLFVVGKTVDEVQLEKAIEIVEGAGYDVVRDASEARSTAMSYGFKVSDPIYVDDNILNLQDLRNYFFNQLWSHYPELKRSYVEGNRASEMRSIRMFVESRELTGLNRHNAIQECAAIINVIFENKDQFNFSRSPGIWVLGQAKAGWITGKAVNILNEQLQKEAKENLDRRFESMESEYEKEIDLNETSDMLNKLLNDMEASNG